MNIHQKAFSHFFLTQLGGEFLRNYYGLVLHYRAGIMLVSEGPVLSKASPAALSIPRNSTSLMWRSKRTFVLPVLSALVRHPSLAAKVLYGVHRIQTPESEWPARSCELSSIAVAPETSGNGLGKALMRAFLAQARSMDAQCVYLTTDADGNDAVNAFYRDVGFQAHAAVPAAQRTLDERIRHQRHGSRQQLRDAPLTRTGSGRSAAGLLQAF